VTAGVWQRGALQDDYGLEPSSMEWFQGAVEYSPEPRHEKLKFTLPEGLRLSAIASGKNLSQMLADGELEALFSATQPSAYAEYDHVQRLFPNFKSVEQEYFQRTGIMPIMHVVVIKKSLYEKYPWVARTLQKAFAASMEYAYQAVEDRGALRYILPWLEDHLQETRKVMGRNRYWEDGFKQNRHVIDRFLEYSYTQGLAKKRHLPEDIFAPNCLDAFVV
jgi:4,5-dihydroxyphthalate decarboxylase